MSEQLPAPEFDSQNYERPNQKWICGHAAEGKPCRPGPDRRGRCQATFECAPLLEKKPGETKGRWRCTRPGGACESGPLPDGTCCRPIPKCSPVPTLRLRRGRLTLAVMTATVALLLIFLGNPSLRTRFINPGELSTPHSGEAFAKLAGSNQIDQTCGACHKAGAFGPSGMTTAAFHASPGPFEIVKLAKAQPAEMTAIDGSCQKCHTSHVFHQPNVVRDISCSFCHAEHRGAGPMLSSTDANCAFCHGDAEIMAASVAKRLNAPLTPALSPSDGEREKNRKTAGLSREGDTTEDERSLSLSLSERERAGVRVQSNRVATAATGSGVVHSFAGDHPEFRVHANQLRDPNTLKFGHALHLRGDTIPKLPGGQKLDCAFCHQPDAAGIYFRRINFESHCRICHSLQFDSETPGLTLPHGDPDFVSAFLHSLPKQYADYAARSGITRAEEQKEFVQQKLQHFQARVVSGEDFEKRIFFSTAMTGPPTQVGTVSGATRALYPGCAYCHEVKSKLQGVAEITQPAMFDRWLLHGAFNHAKHSGVACAQCHQAGKSKVTEDIILPGKDSCATCHSPRGGVADSCATCHVYHKSRKM